MRILGLAGLALLLEVGWLSLWPLSSALSHSPAFTTALLAGHEPARALFGVTLGVARRVLPGLPSAAMAEPLGAPAYLEPTVALAAVMLVLAAGYLVALHLLSRDPGRQPQWPALLVVSLGAVAFQTTLLWQPGLFSQDVFSYIAYGRLAAVYELNPYVWPPSAIGKDAVVAWVAEVWRTYPAPYGPIWEDVQWLMARLCGSLPLVDQALAYRLLANALLLLNLALLWWLAGRLTRVTFAQRTAALAALAWNPLVLFEIAGNAHNDVLMVSFSLLAIAALVGVRGSLPAAAAFTLGALVKYLSGVGLLWLAVAALASQGTWQRRLLRAAAIGLTAAILTVGLAAPWLELPDSLDPLLNETAGVGYVNALPDSLAVWLARSVAPTDAGLEVARSIERLLVLGVFGIYLIWESRRIWTHADAGGVARACLRASLVYVLVVSASVQTWYLCLPVALAAAIGWQAALSRVAIGYSLLALPALYVHYYLRDATPGWVDGVYGLAPLLALVPGWAIRLRRRAGARPHEPAAEAVGDHDQRAGWHRVAGTVVEEASG